MYQHLVDRFLKKILGMIIGQNIMLPNLKSKLKWFKEIMMIKKWKSFGQNWSQNYPHILRDWISNHPFYMEIFGKQYQIHFFFLSVWRKIEKLFFRSGNIGQVGDECTIFDAASFYGHHEYDLGIAGMFGGFSNEFYKRKL